MEVKKSNIIRKNKLKVLEKVPKKSEKYKKQIYGGVRKKNKKKSE